MTKRTVQVTPRYLIEIEDEDTKLVYYRNDNPSLKEIQGFITKDGKYMTPVLAFIQRDLPNMDNKTLISADEAEEASVNLVGIDSYIEEYIPEEF